MTEAIYRIRFYRSVTGRCQACDYARAMPGSHQAKAKRWFKALSQRGPDIPADYGKHLRDSVWELRVVIQRHQHRFLYLFWNRNIVVTNAFLKKTGVVPPAEIEKALRTMSDWVARHAREEP